MDIIVNDKLEDAYKKIISLVREGKSIDNIRSEFRKFFETINDDMREHIITNLQNEGLSRSELNILFNYSKNTGEETQPTNIKKTAYPIQILVTENKAIRTLIKQIEAITQELNNSTTLKDSLLELRSKFALLNDIEKHYKREEELFFPILAKLGYEIQTKEWLKSHRNVIKKMKNLNKDLSRTFPEEQKIRSRFKDLFNNILQIIRQEEMTILPLMNEKFTAEDWTKIQTESDSLGYCIVVPPKRLDPEFVNENFKIRLPTGHLHLRQLVGLFSNLPFQITYVDENDRVIYFSQGTEPIFNRNLVVLGRLVQNCHPPKSVSVVNRILHEFKNNKRDLAEFWLYIDNKFVLIKYIAVRDPTTKKYLGCVEITQNITEIKNLKGEKRLLSTA